MTTANYSTCMGRIRSALPESPIAVFLCDKPNKVDVVFADTVATRQIIALAPPNLVGVFHGGDNLKAVAALIKKSLCPEPALAVERCENTPNEPEI